MGFDEQEWCGMMNAAAAEIERLRTALAPFAQFSDRYPEAKAGHIATQIRDPFAPVTMGDMHRAREVLTTDAPVKADGTEV
jgi:hypothetical protein